MMNRSRPVIDIPRTTWDSVLEGIALLCLVALLLVTLWGYLTLPATIPTHFNAAGQADRYGSKITFFVLPVVALVLYALLSFLGRRPQLYNYPVAITAENAARQYLLGRRLMQCILAEIMLTFLVLQWLIIQAARTGSSLLLFAVPVVVLLIFVTLIVYISKARQAR